MKEAIEKAIEGGWLLKKGAEYKISFGTRLVVVYPKGCLSWRDTYGNIWVDPLFWQALGKALGWRQPVTQYGYTTENGGVELTQRWRCEWHRFIDHLAAGKDADEFFSQLLNKN